MQSQKNYLQVSIIIVNYNTYELTCRCIESIYKYTKEINYEIILVDNGSNECSPTLFLERFPNINLISNNDNLGFAAGNNIGIKSSIGEYILLLNSDTLLVENSIQKVYEKFLSIKNLGVATVKLIYPDGRLQQVASSYPSLKKLIINKFKLKRIMPSIVMHYIGEKFNYESDFEADWVWGAFFYFPRNNLKLFNNCKLHEEFFMYWEDVLWCFHLKIICKKKNYYFSGTKLIHYCGGSSSGNDKVYQLQNKNLYTFLAMSHGKLYIKIYKILNEMIIFNKANKIL